MAKVENVNKVIRLLEQKMFQRVGTNPKPSVIVGYTAGHALFVHEARGMVLKGVPRASGRGRYWDPQGRARAGFLLDVAREQRKEISKTVNNAVKAGHTLEQGLVLGGLLLQRESQLACPVDTGTLKASAFTRKE